MSRRSADRDAAWSALEEHRCSLRQTDLRGLFAADPSRSGNFMVEADGLLYDFSRQLVTRDTLHLLIRLAEACGVEEERARMLSGLPVNGTENRAVLHTALRMPAESRDPGVEEVLEKMSRLSRDLRSRRLRGVRGKALRHLLHIGIGGSDLGPRMAVHALSPDSPRVSVDFAANLDGEELAPLMKRLNPDVTLVCVVSKSFTTLETLTNAETVRSWLRRGVGARDVGAHLMAVTASPGKAVEWGVPRERILPFREWVGGRFSLPSAVGFPVMAVLGDKGFSELLAGMHAMDLHFENTPLPENIPVLMALMGVWNGNILGARSLAVIPYCEPLRWFPLYLQQLEMESNGKAVDRNGNPLDGDSAPVIWGDVGTNAQHAFFQHLHQGGFATPCDFIGFAMPREGRPAEHHRLLMANMLAQAAALAFGRTAAEAREAGVTEKQLPWRVFPGNRPSSILLMKRLSPFNLGRLVALYEHKVFVQGVLWNIFSFDQWGVELGKGIAADVMQRMEGGEEPLDQSTEMLLDWMKRP